MKKLIDPVIFNSKIILNEKERFKVSLKKFSNWTHSSNRLNLLFDDFCGNPEDFSLARILEVTAILEFSLGNVFKSTTTKLPPHLLKDVLSELSTLNCFSENQIFLLQILVGTAKGVNLRNVAWHGFIEDIDFSYLTFLFTIVISYGKELDGKMIISRHRDEIDIKISFEVSESYDELYTSKLINNCHLNAWKIILKFYKTGKFSSGIFLILSQIEGILRHIYGEVNNVDITAQLNKYYVIMDSMFYDYVLASDITPLMIGKITKIQEMEIRRKSPRNKMLEIFPRSLILLHNDLFYWVDGPRIRDKISHGEVEINPENSKEILAKLLRYTQHVANFYDTKESDFYYQSMFMNSFKFVKSFNESSEKLSKTFKLMEIPSDLNHKKCKNIDVFSINCEEIKISFLPLIQSQVTKLMINILENFDKSLENFESSTSELFQLFKMRKLSSGRRDMLKNLIEILPNFTHGLQVLLKSLEKIFYVINELDDKFDNDKWTSNLIKYLKSALKLSENLLRYLSTQHRNYFVANEKICEFLQLTDKCECWLYQF